MLWTWLSKPFCESKLSHEKSLRKIEYIVHFLHFLPNLILSKSKIQRYTCSFLSSMCIRVQVQIFYNYLCTLPRTWRQIINSYTWRHPNLVPSQENGRDRDKQYALHRLAMPLKKWSGSSIQKGHIWSGTKVLYHQIIFGDLDLLSTPLYYSWWLHWCV